MLSKFNALIISKHGSGSVRTQNQAKGAIDIPALPEENGKERLEINVQAGQAPLL